MQPKWYALEVDSLRLMCIYCVQGWRGQHSRAAFLWTKWHHKKRPVSLTLSAGQPRDRKSSFIFATEWYVCSLCSHGCIHVHWAAIDVTKWYNVPPICVYVMCVVYRPQCHVFVCVLVSSDPSVWQRHTQRMDTLVLLWLALSPVSCLCVCLCQVTLVCDRDTHTEWILWFCYG